LLKESLLKAAASIRFGKQMRLMLAAAMLFTSGLAVAQTIAVKHAAGQTTVPVSPKKVIVFDLATLDTMKVLGVKASAVPEVQYPASLTEYADKAIPKVGTLFEPNYEAVFGASPDLIIVAGRSAPKYAELAKIAPTIDLTVDPKDLIGSVKRNTTILGDIFNKKEQAASALAQLDTSIKVLHDKAQKAGPGLIVLTVGNKMSAYGPGSRFGVIHDAFGVKPAATNLTTTNHGQSVSFEYIHKLDPQWLFVIDRDTAIGRAERSAQQVLDNELIRKTTAFKKNHIVYLDSANWYLLGGAGLSALSSNIAQISKAFDAQ
jgi:iron complex transport system substrate-binding protein